MRRVRELVAMVLIGWASHVLPAPERQPLRRPRSPSRSVGKVTITTFHVHPSAQETAKVLRRTALSIEEGFLGGFRIVWNGAPSMPEVLLVCPRPIGEA